MLGLCVYVLGALAAVTFFHLDDSVVQVLELVDVGVCFVFLTDFCVQLVTAKSKLRLSQVGMDRSGVEHTDFWFPAVGPAC